MLLFGLIFLMPFGTYLLSFDLGPIHIFPFRLTLGITVLVLLFTKQLKLGTGFFTKMLSYLFIIWLGYAALSFIWVENYTEAIKDMFYLGTAFSIHLSLVSILSDSNKDKTLGQAWLLGFLVMNVYGMIEMETGKHISLSFINTLNELEFGHPLNFTPVATLDNPNTYSLYLLFSLPIMLLFLNNYKNLLPIFWGIVLYQVVMDSSRFGLIAYIAMASIWIIHSIYVNWKNELPFSVSHVMVAVMIIVATNVVLHQQQSWQFSESFSSTKEYGFVEEMNADSTLNSFQVRKGLMLNGTQFFLQSYGMGIGAGQYSHYNKTGQGNLPTGTVLNPHCFVMEILSQYGIPIFILAFGLMAFMVIFFFRMALKATAPFLLVDFGLMMMVAYLPMSNATSSFMQLPFNWVALALMTIAADRILATKQVQPNLKSVLAALNQSS